MKFPHYYQRKIVHEINSVVILGRLVILGVGVLGISADAIVGPLGLCHKKVVLLLFAAVLILS